MKGDRGTLRVGLRKTTSCILNIGTIHVLNSSFKLHKNSLQALVTNTTYVCK